MVTPAGRGIISMSQMLLIVLSIVALVLETEPDIRAIPREVPGSASVSQLYLGTIGSSVISDVHHLKWCNCICAPLKRQPSNGTKICSRAL